MDNGTICGSLWDVCFHEYDYGEDDSLMDHTTGGGSTLGDTSTGDILDESSVDLRRSAVGLIPEQSQTVNDRDKYNTTADMRTYFLGDRIKKSFRRRRKKLNDGTNKAPETESPAPKTKKPGSNQTPNAIYVEACLTRADSAVDANPKIRRQKRDKVVSNLSGSKERRTLPHRADKYTSCNVSKKAIHKSGRAGLDDARVLTTPSTLHTSTYPKHTYDLKAGGGDDVHVEIPTEQRGPIESHLDCEADVIDNRNYNDAHSTCSTERKVQPMKPYIFSSVPSLGIDGTEKCDFHVRHLSPRQFIEKREPISVRPHKREPVFVRPPSYPRSQSTTRPPRENHWYDQDDVGGHTKSRESKYYDSKTRRDRFGRSPDYRDDTLDNHALLEATGDMSRRELELRCMKSFGGERWTSELRSDDRFLYPRYDKAEARSFQIGRRALSKYDTEAGMYSSYDKCLPRREGYFDSRHRQRSDSHIVRTAEESRNHNVADDRSSSPACPLPASVQIAMGARIARQQSESLAKIAQDLSVSQLRPRIRSVSTPKLRPMEPVQFGAGSLRL